MTHPLMLALMLLGPVFEAEFTIDRPALEIVQRLTAKLPQGTGEHLFPPRVAQILEVVPTHFSINAYPHEHRYVFFAEMLQAPNKRFLRRIRHCNVTVVILAKRDTTVVTSTLDISWGRDGCLSNWYISTFIAPEVLAWEQQKLRKLK
jgi:hypothetical protein